MPSSKIVCPDCKAVLKPAKPVPDGKRVVCPRCKNTFVTPGAAEDEEVVRPAGKKQAAGKQPAGKGAGKKPAPPEPPPKPASDDDDDEGGGIYGVIKTDEEQDEETKPDITYAPDMSIRDLRGPAQALITHPSNGLMVGAVISILLAMLRMAIELWPFIFSDYVVDHQKVLTAYYSKENSKDAKAKIDAIPKDRKDLAPSELAIVEDVTDEEVKWRSAWATISFLIIIYNVFIIIGAVKMQNVESYGWSMAAAILAILPFSGFWLVSLPYGIYSMIVLRNPKVIAGFAYKPAD